MHSVAGVLVELVQAETGITPANKEWVLALQKMCFCLCFINSG
jgi:acetylornithine/succinyldiaminopimelate/putrescine aminotransferase